MKVVDYSLVPGSPEQKREITRLIPVYYQFHLFFAATNIICWGLVLFSLSRLEHIVLSELVAVPLTFLLANFGEFQLHRGLMHHSKPWAKMIFVRHTLQHHRYFTRETMGINNWREAYMILFPPWAVVLIAMFAALASWLSALVAGVNAGWLVFATIMAYYIVYEWMHLLCHLQASSSFAQTRLVKWFSQHHTRHHEFEDMTRYNFNFAFPLFDWLYKTKK